ncbi:hypothetical protein AWQ21_12605 [Picosynechococcus sp. PCC 7003]|uniref:hypothetical protein n=1 Tax=Picosynechococcus sp. PCC 7003 TaxID=374981 RepID=UPI000810ECB3|nr:hypothetical protein [Picosynechococcus sp. PCC 7003]ANV85144.1 hypothetical protein AWQ21_12605 [Picosynechococcus sp. PCC 7003]
MSAALEQEMTTNIMPEVTSQTPEKIQLQETQPSPLITTPAALPETKAGENPLLGLLLLMPFIFLILVAAVIIERLIKWGLRKFFAPQTSPAPAMSSSPFAISHG